jgi:tRNA (cytidine32/uridine32-2'-O)-methyltransferase
VPELPVPEQSIRFVLFEPTHPGNVGAAARAIKTMGFTELVLVNPACELDGVARARSSGALEVLHNARIVATLVDAIDGCGFVVGASARRRRLACPELDPRECAAEVVAASRSKPAAIVFGAERAGLTNAEMDRCNALVYVPSNPEYSSLNLAMAVQIIAYELHWAQGIDSTSQIPESAPASASDIELFYEHLERVMRDSGFLNPEQPRSLMRRLRRLFNRARLDEKELNIMRGLLTALAPGPAKRPAPPAEPEADA